MHGIVFQQLQQFVSRNYGSETWSQVLEHAGLKGKIFMPSQIYQDDEAFSIIGAACRLLNTTPAAVLESFGEFIAPNLIKIYHASIKPEWNAIDLIEHTENTMHKAVRFSDKSATPPPLVCKRLSPSKVQIEYRSGRKMIDLGIGIIKGFGNHYNEKLVIKRTDSAEKTVLEIAKI